MKNFAQLVETEYERADTETFCEGEGKDGSVAGYYAACRKAQELNGVEIFNANKDTSTTYLYPAIIFEFDDGTFCEVAYGYTQVLNQQEVDEIIDLNTNH